MRLTQLFTKTRKQIPADEEARNAQLLIQAGFIHKEMAGVYAYLPLGKRVLDNIAKVVRQEMDAIGAQELQMTTLQPKELFERTDRWDDKKVDNWFKTKLANGSDLGMGLTHEEPIVQALKDYVNSYKDLPIYVYQIQSKFRNELRAKSGLLRGREFIMKDMYSFARTQKEHTELYENAAQAYNKVFDRLGLGKLTYRTYADGGYFTDKFSDEYQTISNVGEDTVYVDEKKMLAINDEIYTPENLTKLGLKKEDLLKKRGVEVANIFPLESKYTDALDLYYTDEKGQQQSIIMGCYGIGVSRLMGIIAEHFADENGLVWPASIAPAQVYLIRLGDDDKVTKAADKLYDDLKKANIEVLYDDRDTRSGAKFADADLLGIPYRLVVSAKTLENDQVELKQRTGQEVTLLAIDKVESSINKP
ncbi:MAG: aminoacyl--tRNA ligase-related protein [Candidatus Saccharibacteria bacterium]